ncbi:unnamed protein product [Larinioides sclopetarius]|uniref:Uncharacterized protein n=1 Tax=Larinioides sclopetarius TaxID=280406 RepID=A0AAV2A3Y4_9ARAC
MSDQSKKLWDLVRDVCTEEYLRLTFKGSSRSGVYTIVGGFAGGLMGPWGVFPGAMAGAFLAESTGEDFKPLWDVITEMPVDAKQRLLDKIKEILQRLDLTDSTTLAAMAAGVAANLRSQISAAVIAFFQTEMSFQAAGR